MRTIIVLAVLGSVAHADPPKPATQVVGQVLDAKHVPVEDVVVRVGLSTTHTNASGIYRIGVPAAGAYTVKFDYGTARDEHPLQIADGQTAVVDGKLGVDLGEVIEVHDKLVPPVAPRPLKSPDILPPYSDAAIVSDTWARAWILLDIDATGHVTRVKWLKRPGHDLDQIAVDTAMATKFAPALDEHGVPMRSFLVHLIEWPSYWWLTSTEGVTTARSQVRNAAVDNPFETTGQAPRDPAASLPCRGGGRPLNLDRVHPVYKDCTPPPDPKLFANVPWTTH